MSARAAAAVLAIAHVCTILLTLRGGSWSAALLTATPSAAWAWFFFTDWSGRDLKVPAAAALAVLVITHAISIAGGSGALTWAFLIGIWAASGALTFYLGAILLRARPETLRRIAGWVFVLGAIGAFLQVYLLLAAFERIRSGAFSSSYSLNAPNAVVDFLVAPAVRLLQWGAFVLYFRLASREVAPPNGMLGLT